MDKKDKRTIKGSKPANLKVKRRKLKEKSFVESIEVKSQDDEVLTLPKEEKPIKTDKVKKKHRSLALNGKRKKRVNNDANNEALLSHNDVDEKKNSSHTETLSVNNDSEEPMEANTGMKMSKKRKKDGNKKRNDLGTPGGREMEESVYKTDLVKANQVSPVNEDSLSRKKEKIRINSKRKKKDLSTVRKMKPEEKDSEVDTEEVVHQVSRVNGDSLNGKKEKSRINGKRKKKDLNIIRKLKSEDKDSEVGTEEVDHQVSPVNEDTSSRKKEKSRIKGKLKKKDLSTARKMKSEEKDSEVGTEEVDQIMSVDEDCSRGMIKWLIEYRESRPGLKVLQQRNDDFIAAYEAQQEQERIEREARVAEGGWTVVAHHKGRKKSTDTESGISVGSVAQAVVMDNVGKKKTKEVGLDFYRFQRREAQRSEVMKLQSKFEQDKKRIQQIRAARKFRPY